MESLNWLCMYFISIYFLFVCFSAALGSMQDLSSPIQGWNPVSPALGSRVLTTGLTGSPVPICFKRLQGTCVNIPRSLMQCF